jgi:Protein of unknown function (DUF1647)
MYRRGVPRTLVTAADQGFFRTLCQMLLSAERHGLHRGWDVLVFDLGLTDAARGELARRFTWCRLRRFPFDRYPAHVRDLTTFAWKPIVVGEVIRERRGTVLWLDSGTLFHRPLDAIVDRIAACGVFSLAGQTPLGGCCDARVLSRLRIAAADLEKPYRAGGALGFDGDRSDVRALVDEWRDLALDPDLIAPPGLDRRTHRFDQALITALLYRAEREQGLAVGDEEIDISSWRPVRWISTRNKVAAWIPLGLDPLVRLYYAVVKRVDRLAIRMRRQRSKRTWRRNWRNSEL